KSRSADREPAQAPSSGSESIRLRLIGANRDAEMKGTGELPGTINYFIGNDPNRWRTNVPAYAAVSCRAVYPGVDLVYYGNQQQLEYDLIVAPGANPETITLGFEGVRSVSIDEAGNLLLNTGVGDIRQHRPFAYQEHRGVKREVPARYAINDQRQVK